MGYLQATEMAGIADIDKALRWHLQHNHYPPVPASMVEPCKLAIIAVSEGDYNQAIELPEGVSYRGLDSAPASEVVAAHHLDPWVIHDDGEV